LWTVASYVEASGVTTGFGSPPIQRATLRLASAGGAQVDTGCNRAEGRYQLDGDRITLSGLAYSEEGCALPLLEDKVQAVLSDGVLEFQIESQRLTLTRGTSGLLLDAP
jgi:heat shock protein HslJ